MKYIIGYFYCPNEARAAAHKAKNEHIEYLYKIILEDCKDEKCLVTAKKNGLDAKKYLEKFTMVKLFDSSKLRAENDT